MRNGSNAVELMEYSFLVVFANGGHLNHDELTMLERLALEDGQVDARERTVLHNIFARARRRGISRAVDEEMVAFEQRFAI